MPAAAPAPLRLVPVRALDGGDKGRRAGPKPRQTMVSEDSTVGAMRMIERLRARDEWKFFAVLPKADRILALIWWLVLVLRGVLPAAFAIAMGALVGAVQRREGLAGALALVGVVFVLLQILSPIHQMVGANLGDRTAAWLYDRLTEACVRPPGMGHLEDPALTNDLTVARDFDLGMTGPPLSISMDFIANGMVEMTGGIASAVILARYAWWAPIVLAGAWLATHWLLRESAIWRDRNTDEVRGAQRDAEYAYRLAVDPPASKELRLFGLAAWTIERFRARRSRLHDLQYAATRLRERPVVGSVLLVVSANVLVFWVLAEAAAAGRITLGEAVVYVQSAIGVSAIAFGGFSWALDGAAAPVAAVLRLEPAMRPAGALASGQRSGRGPPARSVSATSRSPIRRAQLRRAGPPRPCSSTSTSRSRRARPSPSWDRTAPARRRSRSCCAGCTTRSRGRSRSTAWTCARSISPRGGSVSPPSSRTSCAWSCPCATTWLRRGRPITSSARPSSRRARPAWPGWIRSCPAP